MKKANESNKTNAIIISTIGAFITPFMGSSLNIALPSIGKEFSMTAQSLNWIITGYILTTAIFLVPFGRVADLKGRKKVYIYGMIIYTFSVFLCSISTSSTMLLLFRMIQGIGSAFIFSTGTAILISIIPPGERGFALGINVSATYFGLSVGPFLGGFLTHYLGWRSIFITNIPVALAVIYLAIWKLKGEWITEEKKAFDFLGSILYSLSLILLMFGFTLLPGTNGLFLILFGLVILLGFLIYERRIENAILELKLLKHNITFTFSNLAALINYSATFAVSFLLSLYLQYIKGFNPQDSGLILVAQPVMMALFSPLAGKISDKVEPRIVSSIGMGLAVISLLLFTLINQSTNLLFIILGLVILGFGFALFSSPNTNAVMSSVDKKYLGVAAAMLSTMRMLGQTLSMGIALFIFSIILGNVQIKPEYHNQFLLSIKYSFIIFSALCFMGVFASLARGKVRK